MKKLNSLATLLICTVLTSGCAATPLEIKQAENEPLCWGNINAKSHKINTIGGIMSGLGPIGYPAWAVWVLASKTLHAAAATANPNCYYSDKSDSNSSNTSDDSNPASSTDKDIE